MKYFIFVFAIIFYNQAVSQSLTYAFAGSDADKKQFKCGESRKIKLIAEGFELKNIEYQCKDESVTIKKLNDKILEVTPNRLCDKVEILALINGESVASIEVPVYCVNEPEIILFGARDGDTLCYSDLKSPLDLVLYKKFTDEYIDINSFEIIVIQKGKVTSWKCSNINCIWMDEMVSHIKKNKSKSLTVMLVKANRISPLTGEEYETIYGNAIINFKK